MIDDIEIEQEDPIPLPKGFTKKGGGDLPLPKGFEVKKKEVFNSDPNAYLKLFGVGARPSFPTQSKSPDVIDNEVSYKPLDENVLSSLTTGFKSTDSRVGGDRNFEAAPKIASGKTLGKAAVLGLSSVASGTLESIGIAAKELDFFNEYKGKTAEELGTYKMGKWLDESVKDLVGDLTPEEQANFSVKLAQAAGQLGGIWLGGAAARGTTFLSGVGTTATLGAATGAAAEYNNALNSGATPDQAAKMFWISGAINAADVIPFMTAFRKLDKYTGGLATGALAKQLASSVAGRITSDVAQQFVTGAVTNSVQQLLTNVAAKNIYDTTRNIWQDVGESGAIGGILSSAMTTVLSTVRERRAAGNLTPEEDAELAKTEKFAEQKIKEEKAKENNTNHAVKVKENVSHLPEKHQNEFVKQSLTEKLANEKAEKLTDPTLIKEQKEIAKESHEIKQQILAGKDPDEIVTEKQQKEIDEKEKTATELKRLEEDHKINLKKIDDKIEDTDGRESKANRTKLQELNLEKERLKEDYEKKVAKLKPPTDETTPIPKGSEPNQQGELQTETKVEPIKPITEAIKGTEEKEVGEFAPDVEPVKAGHGTIFSPARAGKTLNEKQQALVNELPKIKVNYKDLKGIGDLSIYLNNPDALDSPHLKSAKKIYEDIKNGKQIKDTPSVNATMDVMDGQNRIAAQLAAGIENIDVAVIDKSFYDKQNQPSTPKPSTQGGVRSEEKTQQTENQEPPPPENPEPVVAGEGGGNKVGVSHAALTDLSKRLGLKEPERGEYLSPSWYAERGRQLLAEGANPNEVDNPNNTLHDRISIARAHLENLVKASDEIARTNPEGINSEKYKEAWKQVNDYSEKVKGLGTEAHRAMTSLQGSRDIDTDSFTAVRKATEEEIGKPLNEGQEKKIKELTTENTKLKLQTEDLEKKLVEATEKAVNETEGKQTKEQKAKSFADKIRKAKIHRPGMFSAATPASIVWDASVEVVAKAVEAGGKIVDAIEKGVKYLQSTDWYKKLNDTDKKEAEKQFTEWHEEAIEETPEVKTIRRLQKELENLQKGIAKQKGIKIEDTQEIKDLRDEVFEAKKNLGLIRSKNLPQSKIKITEEQKRINRLEKQLTDLEQGIVKEKTKEFEDTPRIKELKEKIFEQKKNLGLIPGNEVKTAGSLKITETEKKIERLEKEKADLEKGVVKQKNVSNEEPSPAQKEKIEKLKEGIHDLKKELGILKSKEEKPLTEEEQKEQDAKELEEIQKKFVDKTDNKFSIDEAKTIWDYAKKNYLDKGVNYRDMLVNVKNDLGLSWKQTSDALTSKKIKPVSDNYWKKQSDYKKSQIATKNWVEAQGRTLPFKALRKISAAFRGVSVFGHGGIFIGTHAGMTLFSPSQWHVVIPAFIRGWKFAYGNKANYERRVEQLRNSPNYVKAQRAGLKNNPDIVNTEEFQKSQEFFKKIGGEAGIKGFNAIKVLRQDLFDYHYDRLSEVEKNDPESLKQIAKLVNNATGATNLNLPKWVEEVSFAGGMEATRWGKWIRNPARATAIAVKALIKPESATVAERVFAKVWARRVGEQLATYAGLLAANAALQYAINPKNPVNLTNPNKPDWLKFKFGDVTVDPTSGMRGAGMFAYGIGKVPFESKKQLRGDTPMQAAGKQTFSYGRGKLAPFYSTVADFFDKKDFNKNPLPFSNEKPTPGHHKLTWPEYAWQKAPLPVAHAAQEMYHSALDNGDGKMTKNHIVDGIISGFISGGTGLRVGQYNEEESNHSPFTEEDKKDPVFKYYLDKGLELPNTVPSSEDIKLEDIPNLKFQEKKLSDLPKEKQDEYSNQHKIFLKEELKKPIDAKRVYVDNYGHVHINIPNQWLGKTKELDKLSKDELAEIEHEAQSTATERAKDKLFHQFLK